MLAKHALSQLSYGPLVLLRKAKGFSLASDAGGDVRRLGLRRISAGGRSALRGLTASAHPWKTRSLPDAKASQAEQARA